jgi:lipoprotein NlpD
MAELRGPYSGVALISALLALTACGPDRSFDLDLRDNLGTAFDTTAAVQEVADRPRPDNRGVISYPGYQVAIARRGDTIASVAGRVGLPAEELARYNGVPSTAALRSGEVVALPRRVAEPSPATGSPTTGPIRPAAPITATPLEESASAAIARGEQSAAGAEPTRHRVQSGETAFSIARRYGVPVEALAEWNGLDGNMTVREGSYLLIPVVEPAAIPESRPGQGTVVPPPPSAAEPLPEENATQNPPEETPEPSDLGAEATASSASDARLTYPVQGSVIRAFSKGTNDGIDLSAPAGTPVRAADAGTVAAITRDTDQVPILVLRHSGGLLTVYAGVANVTVEKGDSVSRGETIAQVRSGDPSFLHFEVREGFDSVDPADYLD